MSLIRSSSDATRRSTLGHLVDQSTFLLMVAIGSLILVLAFLILFHENANATKGYRLRSLERERSILLLELEVQNMHRAQAQALQHLKEDPQVVGMITATKPHYVQAEERVAAR